MVKSLAPRLMVIVGNPGSGKDLIIQAINDLGVQHAAIVPKHTNRDRRDDDRNEMICCDDPEYDMDACDVRYTNYGTEYGIESSRIWSGLARGVFQVAVVSNVAAINLLREKFGRLLLLVYIYSQTSSDEFQQRQSQTDEYVTRRAAEYEMAHKMYIREFLAFDHVLIYTEAPEDLFDQIFRLFRAYETGLLG